MEDDDQTMCRTFGSRLRAARLNAGITQSRAAAACGVSESSYAAYERGNRWPRSGFLSRFAELCSQDLEELFPGPALKGLNWKMSR